MPKVHKGDAAFAVILSRRRGVLLVKKTDGPWGLPGGRIEPGETVRGALRREVEEETGLRLREASFVGARRRAGRNAFLFLVARRDTRGRLVGENDEIDRQKWVSPRKALRLLPRRHARRLGVVLREAAGLA